VGRLDVTAVLDTENKELPVSLTLKRLPILPLAPIFKDSKSPVAVTADPGDQSKDNSPPVVNPVAVDEIAKALLLVKVLAVIVEGELLANPDVIVTSPDIVGVAVHEVGETVKPDPAMVVPYEALPKVTAPPFPWKVGEETEVATVAVPVKLAALEIVCPLIRPDVIVPIFIRLPEASTLCVPAPTPVYRPETALTVPGALKSVGILKTTAPVVGEDVI